MNRLNIIQTAPPAYQEKPLSLSRGARKKEQQAKFERLWLTNPERFNPLRNCVEQERFERTWRLLTQYIDLVNKQTADIGCAAGFFSRRLRAHGARVDGIDIAENALKQFEKEGSEQMTLKRDAMPETKLSDEAYDVIICTELIADLPPDDHRLFFAELARLIKKEGFIICSSAIDIDSEGGVEKLIELAQTEFDLLDEVLSYHALSIKIKRILKAPAYFIEGWKNKDYRKKQLSSRYGLNKWWYRVNSAAPLSWLWVICEPLTRPLLKVLRNSPRLMLFLEKICHFVSDRDGISHYLFIAKKRSLNL